jgi:uroporphyrinogen decarboxylase
MRQAGRYHQHYQKLRREHSFMDLCKSPRLAAEVALGPVHDFDFDVSILFSDLLFPLEALGLGLAYDPAPRLERHLNPGNLKSLSSSREAAERLQFQADAVRETRSKLPTDKSLIGFVGGPWTLFTYAVEGEHKGHLLQAKMGLQLFRAFGEVIQPVLESAIGQQLAAGAETVMIFDTAAGELSPAIFRREVAPALSALARKFPGRVGYYARGITSAHLRDLTAEPAFAGFGYDHRWDLTAELVAAPFGFRQGNFDQALLFLNEKDFARELDRHLEAFRNLTPAQRRYWVCGLGHGVLPGTPEANVRAFVRRVREVFG